MDDLEDRVIEFLVRGVDAAFEDGVGVEAPAGLQGSTLHRLVALVVPRDVAGVGEFGRALGLGE